VLAWRLASPRPKRAIRDDVDPLAYLLVFGAAWIVTEWLRATVVQRLCLEPARRDLGAAARRSRGSQLGRHLCLSGLAMLAAGGIA
jgi:hypothetical protein